MAAATSRHRQALGLYTHYGCTTMAILTMAILTMAILTMAILTMAILTLSILTMTILTMARQALGLAGWSGRAA